MTEMRTKGGFDERRRRSSFRNNNKYNNNSLTNTFSGQLYYYLLTLVLVLCTFLQQVNTVEGFYLLPTTTTTTTNTKNYHQLSHRHQLPFGHFNQQPRTYRHRQIFRNIRGGGDTTIASSSSSSSSSSALQAVSMDTMMTLTTNVLKTGPFGVIGLTGIAASVVVPFTMIRQGYSFSVGYGYSIMMMGLVIAQTFGIDLLAVNLSSPLALLNLVVIFYGFRLGSFLLIREYTVPSKAEQVKSFDKSSKLQRLPLALSVSMFYAFMTSPLLYAARYFTAGGGSVLEPNLDIIMKIGILLSWTGAIMETVADVQKYLSKRNGGTDNDVDESKFVGPTSGLYKLCRHPNYFGEVMYWFGLFVAGVPTFGKNIVPFVCGLLGLYGIYGIMSNASKRLDEKQNEKYVGQIKYETYKSKVKGSLFPFWG